MVDISVLIVNYNTAALVKQCVESVLKQQGVNFEVIVVDNQSQDDSVAVLQQFGSQITLIANTDNKGFGKANNQAFKQSGGRYIFMLNPDAVCLTKFDLQQAVQYMDVHAHYGLAGTRIVNAAHQLEHTAFHFYPRQKQTTADFSHLPGELATVLGASMIARREAFAAVNGFDEAFFLYGEETDLCLRLRKAGYLIGYCETVTVQHIGSASEKGNPREEILRKKKAGKILFYSKHYPPFDVIKMMRRDLRRARWHWLRLSLLRVTVGLNKRQESKFRQHRVVMQLAKDYLEN